MSRSDELLARARAVTPEATQTLSKGPSQFVQGPSPVFIERGSGARVWDAEGVEYLDFPMALGPILLGYGYPAVDAAIRSQLELGITFTLPSPLEAEVAEKLVAAVPCAEMVRFAKSGSEATAGAIRLARAVTGRDRVATSGYHGWHDWFAGQTGRDAGVPRVVSDLTVGFEFNDTASLESVLDTHPGEFAAVIIEPATALAPKPGFLDGVAALTRRHGALLVFDEIITGLRWSRGGAQERYGITPDLATLGKALGNGMPISAICGPAELMKGFESIFVSGTHGGELLSLAAAGAVLDEIEVAPVVDHIWNLGGRLMGELIRLVTDHGLSETVTVTGEPPRVVLSFPVTDRGTGSDGKPSEDLTIKSLLQQELAKRRILFNGSLFTSYSHTESDIDEAVDAFDQALGLVADAVESGNAASLLEGPPVQPVFRRT